ncbi:MAG: hypothetical protein EHM48_06465 [Planctomycetaceae bacterium]|nr:MAG: hypothetical protein EHM48_06465 [Planctomycetaceae bacterium]
MPSYDLVQSVGRALDILELVVNSETGLDLNGVVAFTFLKTATAHNLLRTLVAKGFLEKSRNPIRYYPGPILLNYRRSERDSNLFNHARPIMAQLAHSLGGEVRLCESVGMRTVSMLIASPSQSSVEQPRTPRETMIYGMGVVFQAYWSKREIAEYDKKYNFKLNGQKWGTREKLNRFLAGFRKNHVAMIPVRITGNHFRVAAPIFGWTGKMTAIICFTKPIKQTNAAFRQTCYQAIYKAGKELSFKR